MPATSKLDLSRRRFAEASPRWVTRRTSRTSELLGTVSGGWNGGENERLDEVATSRSWVSVCVKDVQPHTQRIDVFSVWIWPQSCFEPPFCAVAQRTRQGIGPALLHRKIKVVVEKDTSRSHRSLLSTPFSPVGTPVARLVPPETRSLSRHVVSTRGGGDQTWARGHDGGARSGPGHPVDGLDRAAR